MADDDGGNTADKAHTDASLMTAFAAAALLPPSSPPDTRCSFGLHGVDSGSSSQQLRTHGEGELSSCASAGHQVHHGQPTIHGMSIGECCVRGGQLAGSVPLPMSRQTSSSSRGITIQLQQATSCPSSWSLPRSSPPGSLETGSLSGGRGCASTSGSGSSYSLLHSPHSLLEHAEQLVQQCSGAGEQELMAGALIRLAELSVAAKAGPHLTVDEESCERATRQDG